MLSANFATLPNQEVTRFVPFYRLRCLKLFFGLGRAGGAGGQSRALTPCVMSERARAGCGLFPDGWQSS
jgi:hypothetical protein